MKSRDTPFAKLVRCSSVAGLSLILAGCDKPPTAYKAEGPFPICYRTGESYSQHELIDKAIQVLITHSIDSRCRKYSSVAEFYRVNPGCCSFVPNVAPGGDKLVTNSQFGEPLGTITAHYYCGFDEDGVYRDYEATLTSCGLPIQPFQTSVRWRELLDYPAQH